MQGVACEVLRRHVQEILGPILVTENDVRDFAEYAFGADGLPELQVLAFGDFALTFSGRRVDGNHLYCRAEPASPEDPIFRLLSLSNEPM